MAYVGNMTSLYDKNVHNTFFSANLHSPGITQSILGSAEDSIEASLLTSILQVLVQSNLHVMT